jgi:hypothetical protein
MALLFERLFGNCPVCEQKFRNHSAALLAETSHDGSETQKDFLAAVKSHDWDSLLYVSTHVSAGYLPLRLCAIRCVTGRIAVVVVSYVDLFAIEPEVFDFEVLGESESFELAALIRGEYWTSFDGRARRFWENLKNRGASTFGRST